MGEAGLQCSLTRAELEAMAEPLLARVGAACAQAMSDSGLRRGDLHAVELVGGFSRMPAVQGVLQQVRSPPPLPPSSPCGLAPPLCPACISACPRPRRVDASPAPLPLPRAPPLPCAPRRSAWSPNPNPNPNPNQALGVEP